MATIAAEADWVEFFVLPHSSMKFTPSSLAAGLLAGSLLLSSTPAFAVMATTITSKDRCDAVRGREQERCINVNNQTRIRLRQISTGSLVRTQLRRERRATVNQKTDITNVQDRANQNSTARVRASIQPISRRSLIRSIETTPQLKCSRLQGTARARCLQGAYKTQLNQEGNEP